MEINAIVFIPKSLRLIIPERPRGHHFTSLFLPAFLDGSEIIYIKKLNWNQTGTFGINTRHDL